MALAQHQRTPGSAGTAPRRRGPDPTGAPLALERARPSQRAAHGSAPERGSVHDWVARRAETARISLKRKPRFRLAPRGGQNGTRPGYMAILHGECALGALEGRFWFPDRSGHIGGRAPLLGAPGLACMACPGTLTCIWRSPESAAAPAACWRRCGVMAVSTFIVTCVPSCCSLQELLLAMSRCEVLGRVSPGRAGWRSLAVVALAFFLSLSENTSN